MSQQVLTKATDFIIGATKDLRLPQPFSVKTLLGIKDRSLKLAAKQAKLDTTSHETNQILQKPGDMIQSKL